MAKHHHAHDTHCDHSHSEGCDCTPALFVDMIESAGLELSRRGFIKGLGALGGLMAFGGLAAAAETPLLEGTRAETIYFGGPIRTMVSEDDQPEALAVAGGRILATGSLQEVMATRGDDTRMIDLAGKTLMPGFFDPHSHVALQSVKFSTANLDPKPIGEAGSIADIQRILRDWIKEKDLKPGQWVIGWGYDDTGIEEKRHPTREDLDAVSTDHPILLVHISCHLMTGNSRMMEACDITADTPDPKGGVIQREPGSQTPNGVLEENAMMLAGRHLPMPTPEQAMTLITQGLERYAEAGITTAQDCATFQGTWNLLSHMDEQGLMPIDVITWPLYEAVDDDTFSRIAANPGMSHGRLRLGGIKFVVDGSIQGYTAYLSEPYYVQPGDTAPMTDKCNTGPAERLFISADNQETQTGGSQSPTTTGQDFRGYANMTQEQLVSWISRCDASGIQFQAHTNGDAATDMLLKAVETVRKDKPRPDLRSTVIHAQTMRDDQLDTLARQGMTPSFFPIHVYFWGDRHRDQFLGPARASRIDPARSALDRKLKISLHHDAPVAGISMLNVAWSAINRVTTSGKELGPEQKLTPFEAFRAITADAAWQNFQEDRKGTLEVGKLADMVLLSGDPMTVDPMTIRDLKVVQTLKEGRVVYSAQG
ncbi:amidohydrolase family protein [Thiohalocapsa marina]|uniref:Amidohydrolase family protein n=1 Tax=Thiohalocapsa marina TaxID=424902 RepID=A0A5M8FI07_9GAMM|nr:amidohydrolase family protein [Thiohalocapsa marina]KAA6184543.1 amidohydrolase family protein [Thiohalocapsa marina]